MFLSNVMPLDERSALNLLGSLNTSHALQLDNVPAVSALQSCSFVTNLRDWLPSQAGTGGQFSTCWVARCLQQQPRHAAAEGIQARCTGIPYLLRYGNLEHICVPPDRAVLRIGASAEHSGQLRQEGGRGLLCHLLGAAGGLPGAFRRDQSRALGPGDSSAHIAHLPAAHLAWRTAAESALALHSGAQSVHVRL